MSKTSWGKRADARAVVALAALTLVGCPDSRTLEPDASVDGGRDAGSVDGGPVADAGPVADSGVDCAAASEGASCELEGAFCGGPCTDQCSFCNVLRCESGTWQRLEVFPAPCFDCGDGLRCVAGEDYCQHAFSDVGGEPDSFECRPLPAACIGDATCACLGEELAFDMCLEPNPGELEVQFFGGRVFGGRVFGGRVFGG